MPFKNIQTGKPEKEFDEIDRIILSNVFPNLAPYIASANVDYFRILPNRKPTLFPDEEGRMCSKDPTKYFALLCRKAGLKYSEIGLWLDTCVAAYIVKHTDGRTRRITAEKESSLRFDERKPIYYFYEEYRYYLVVRHEI